MKNNQIESESSAEALVAEVYGDFNSRRAERRGLEAQWQLNMEFLNGRQYACASASGEIVEDDGGYFWQSRNVFNHVLPVVDTRLAKLARVRPAMLVRPATADEVDKKTAEISAKVLNSTCARINMDEVISSATRWSEVTGTAFYKIGWNGRAGSLLGVLDGKEVREGDVDVEVVSPFEIFPDLLTRERVEDCDSIIRARVVDAHRIAEVYGVKVCADEAAYSVGSQGRVQGRDCVTLIERYEKPCDRLPFGRVVTVAGGKLLCVEELPYVNAPDGERSYPFVRQVSQLLPGSFFGEGIITRLIPVQRAYNTVRNRKHEFLSRISLGVLTVEDGSVDVDALVDEGLQPGRVLVYRQGSVAPRMMEAESIPSDFEKEEEKLLEEFVLLGGVNEVSSKYKQTLGVTSAAGLQILLEQDDERLTVPTENIRRAVRETAKHVIRLFKQFATQPRLMRLAGEGQTEVFIFSASDITSDDVVFETDNELSFSPSQRRASIMELISSGLLAGEDGRIPRPVKDKLLELLGYGALVGTGQGTTLVAGDKKEQNQTVREGEADCSGDVD